MTASFPGASGHDATKQDAATAATDSELSAEAAARAAADALKQDASTAATDAEVTAAVASEAGTRSVGDAVLTLYDKDQSTAKAMIRREGTHMLQSATLAKQRFDDANNGFWHFNDQWTDATGWTTQQGTTYTTSGNRAYGTTGVNIMTRGTAFAPGTTLRFRYVGRFKWVPGGSGNSIMFGVTTADGNPGALNGCTAIYLDSAGVINKYWSSAGQGGAGGQLGGAGDVIITVVGDENYVSFHLTDTNRIIDTYFTRTRAQVGAITKVFTEITDSRGSSGLGLGPVGANSFSMTTLPVRTNVEGVAYQAHNTFSANGDGVRIELPPAYDSRVPAPLYLHAHEYGGSQDSFSITPGGASGLPDGPYYKALLDGGMIVAECNAGGQLMGNQASIDRLKDAYDYIRNHYAISGVILGGNSMGANTGLGAIAQRKIPASGFLGVCPSTSVVSLGLQCQTNGGATDTDFRAAWGVAANYSDLVSKTAGYDWISANPSAFRGVPMWMATASNDANYHLTADVATMGTKLAGWSDFTQFNAGAVGHLASACFDTSGPAAALGWVI